MINTQCKICGNHKGELRYSNSPGYVKNQFFDVYHCRECNTSFVPLNISEKDLKSLYERIYLNSRIRGYDKYAELSIKIKREKSPQVYLSKCYATYFGILKALKGERGRKILDVGCGLGYLTFALNGTENVARGIDVSSNAIERARNNFGDLYENIDLEEFVRVTDEKFDFLIAAEIIEHLQDPMRFVKLAFEAIDHGGKLILTTPNKDYHEADSIWFTDPPPVHLYWFTRKSLEVIADKCKADIEFVRFNDYYPSDENRLVKYFRLRKKSIRDHVVNEHFEPFEGEEDKGKNQAKKIFRFIVHNFAPIRNASNFLYNVSIEKADSMVAILTKR